MGTLATLDDGYFCLVCQKLDNKVAANVAKHLYLQGCLINLMEKWYVVGASTQTHPVFVACQNAAQASQPRLMYIISLNGDGS